VTRFLRENLVEQLINEVEGGGWTLVPLPLSPTQFRQQGFNPAVLLARAITYPGLPIVECLRHRETGREHVKKSKRERLAKLRRTFTVIHSVPKKIILVDDVVTTGTALGSAAKALKKAGAEAVIAIILAYDPKNVDRRAPLPGAPH